MLIFGHCTEFLKRNSPEDLGKGQGQVARKPNRANIHLLAVEGWNVCGSPRPSLCLLQVVSVALLLPCPPAPEEKAQEGNYRWFYQKQVLCRFFSWKSARHSAGGHDAWSVLALPQKDHREVDCVVAFTGLRGLRMRHTGEEELTVSWQF